MSHFNSLPAEIVEQILVKTYPLDRRSVELTCKRFHLILRNNSQRLPRLCIQSLDIKIHEVDHTFYIQCVLVTSDERYNNAITYLTQTFSSRHFFLTNLKQLKCRKGFGIIIIKFWTLSSTILIIRKQISTLSKARNIEIHYLNQEGAIQKHLHCICLWALRHSRRSKVALKMSFRDFIYTHRNEVFQMKRRAHFAIYSESREGNYDTDDWARFLNANEIEKLEFTCLEHICIEDLIEFVRFMLRATRNKQIREFVINLEASHYTPYQINVMRFFGLQDYHFVKGKIIQTHYVITMMKFANPAQNNVINQSGVILYFHGDFVKH